MAQIMFLLCIRVNAGDCSRRIDVSSQIFSKFPGDEAYSSVAQLRNSSFVHWMIIQKSTESRKCRERELQISGVLLYCATVHGYPSTR